MIKSPIRFLAMGALLLVPFLPAAAQVPNLISYQGLVKVGTVAFNGSGLFKLALVDATGTTTFWSNDGTSVGGNEPTNAVTLAVAEGLFSVLLGDTTLANMTAVPHSVFGNSDVHLRVWFSDGVSGFQVLAPTQRVAATGYAMRAARADAVSESGIVTGKATVNVPASGVVNTTPAAFGLPADTLTRNPVVLRASAWTGSVTSMTLLLMASVGLFTGSAWPVRVYDPTGTFITGAAVVELVVRLDPP